MCRTLSKSPASTAATRLPPEAMTATAVNWDAAAKTSIDIATVSHGEIPAARAIAPKDTPTSPVAAAIAR